MSEAAGRPVAGAAVVCLKGEQVLLVQRGREPNRGRWSFPGGKIEPGETARQAAEREAREETSLRVRVLDVVDVYDAIFPPYHFCVADYLAVPEDDADPIPRGDAMDARWVPICHVEDFDLTDAMYRVLQRARWLLAVRDDAPLSLGMELELVAPGGIKDREPPPAEPTPSPHDSTSRSRTLDEQIERLRRLSRETGIDRGAEIAELEEQVMRLAAALGPDAITPRVRVRGLYVITDETVATGRTHVELARAALEGGAGLVQLRDKRRDAGELLPIAREMQDLCRSAGALFIVNDRVDLAAASDADGIHLGQTDLPVEAARRILGPEKLIGISVEDEAQVRQAEAAGADYLGVGAIYGSASKTDAGAPVGPEQIRRFRRISSLPIVAIGGITLERLPEVRTAGADAVAVIGAVAAAPDPAAASRALVQAWESNS